MMTELNSTFKVKEYILKQIKEQSLKPGDKLPSNLSIARELNVKLMMSMKRLVNS